jgi:phosphoesterase RecJ-like protein
MAVIPDRIKRINEACKEALGEIIQKKMKDPRVGFVTVTEVEVTPDLRQAKVWLSIMGSEEETEITMEVLEKARGFMRRELGKRVRMRYTPELKIFLDRGPEISERLQGILHELEEEEMKDLETAVSALKEAEKISISSHVNPDGDSVGSLLGMAMVLKSQGKNVRACMPEPSKFPPQYNFLPGRELLENPDDRIEELDLFVALDCSNPERLGPLQNRVNSASKVLNIDHHEDNQHYGEINLVDEHASSTSELVFRVIEAAGWKIEPEVATCLYAGVVTDTGRFEHRNTSPETFTLASELAEAGADISTVIKEIYDNQSLAYTHLMGLVLQRIEVMEDLGLAYSYVTQRDLAETGAVLPETEDLIDRLRSIRGTKVVALFKELPDGKVRVSLRSRDAFEVGPVARAMGGGGHAMAAGYTSGKNIEESISCLVNELRECKT